MINPLPETGNVAGTPEDNSMIRFIPDSRFTTVHFECYRDEDLVMSLALPFIGWALVLRWNYSDPAEYSTRLVAVGLDDRGQPATAADIEGFHGFQEGKVIQTRLVAANGQDALGHASPDWLTGLLTERAMPAPALIRSSKPAAA